MLLALVPQFQIAFISGCDACMRDEHLIRMHGFSVIECESFEHMFCVVGDDDDGGEEVDVLFGESAAIIARVFDDIIVPLAKRYACICMYVCLHV
jgi:hypothetical protein